MSKYGRMKVRDLKPHPKNEEIYGQNEDVSDLEEKIKRSGQVHTLVATSKGVVLAGHRRLKVCKKLGIEEVDVEIIDFDTPEQEVEYLIDNNATREKTNEQKGREAIALKKALSDLAAKRKLSKLKQNRADDGVQNAHVDVPNSALPEQSTDTPKLAERKEELQESGETRNIVAKKVGLKSGQEVDRAIKTIKKIDELKEEGRTEDADFVRDVMNNRSISAAENLANHIDNIKIPEEEKEAIKAGRKSPNSFIKREKKNKEESEPKVKPAETSDNVKSLENSLTAIQKRYQDYLSEFQDDVKWLMDKEFYYKDEEISNKTHSDLRNCLEKFKSISGIMQKMSIDEFACITIKN